MSSRPDKQRRKELLDTVKAKQRADARSKFPASNEVIREYFDMLYREFPIQGCDHSLRITRAWLEEKQQPVEPFIEWLNENGGFCDCEALANAEEHWQDANYDVNW